jgi:hypothetical protein
MKRYNVIFFDLNTKIKTQQLTCCQHYHTAALPRVTIPPNLFAVSQPFLCVYLFPSFQSGIMQSVTFQILEENGVAHGSCFFSVFRGPMLLSHLAYM